ncbi:CHAD domain-containing protein [Rhodovulum iodosum]|uniref:CHAD domain-containing protein n=1 Tax=Rhodovulum iodosum TaxID=68291 RepID=A0ABV3XYQ2_9RHOB|nr:CHAD domain-containing protein [Rhodovulum robiginosum]RSK34072.1 CHAD domain-containing protein [Rhodovulum robiginosum]
MAYALSRKDRSVQAALRRIATEEIDRALAEIDDPDMPQPEKVHQVRKRAKRLRALIRLVRHAFPGYAAENAAIRDAARGLSALRDSEARVETFDKLMEATHSGGFATIRTYLAAARDHAAENAHSDDDLARFRAELVALRKRVKHWRLTEKGFKALKPGIEKTFGAARRDLRLVHDRASDEDIHDWRKRVKAHWYHTKLLRRLRPKVLKDRAAKARDLGELLGAHHDLAVLRAHIAGAADLPIDADARARFDRLAAARQAELEDEARDLGTRLFSRPAKAIAHRWKGWWRDWRKAVA